MPVLMLALKSLKNRRVTALLTIFSMAVSVALLLGVERIRSEARESFTNTVAGTDLVVGARSSSLNLLLYSVFHIGNASNNITWQSYQQLANSPEVAWTVPVSLGDSHRGYRVVGTSSAMFEHYRTGGNRPLAFTEGGAFDDLYDAVIGAEVAAVLGYKSGHRITLSHGVGSHSLQHHDNKVFRISGIMAATGTPMDRAILVSLEGIEALHADWINGAAPIGGLALSAKQTRTMDLKPSAITAYFVGLKSRVAAFRYQRKVNNYSQEAMTAILPGVALGELWRLVGAAEQALLAVSVLVVIAGLTGMLTTILTSLNERRREMAILRAVGARPVHIFVLMVSESLLYGLLGTALGFALLYGTLFTLQPFLLQWLGLQLTLSWPGSFEWLLVAMVLLAALITGMVPAWLAYRNSLADGLTVRL